MSPSLRCCQCRDYIAKSRQRLVDRFAFFQPLSCGARDHDALTTSEIDQVQFSNFYLLLSAFLSNKVLAHLLYNDNEYGVWSTADIVHFSGGRWSGLLASNHQVVGLTGGAHGPLWQSFNKDTPFGILSDLQTGALSLQQVTDGLIVDLEVTGSNHKGALLSLFWPDVSEYLFHRSGDNSSLFLLLTILESFHCESLASASLTICKDSRIVTWKDRADSRLGRLLVNVNLGRIIVINPVEGELVSGYALMVSVHVALAPLFRQLLTHILHQSQHLLVHWDFCDWTKLNCKPIVIFLSSWRQLSFERGPDSDDNLEVVGVSTHIGHRLSHNSKVRHPEVGASWATLWSLTHWTGLGRRLLSHWCPCCKLGCHSITLRRLLERAIISTLLARLGYERWVILTLTRGRLQLLQALWIYVLLIGLFVAKWLLWTTHRAFGLATELESICTSLFAGWHSGWLVHHHLAQLVCLWLATGDQVGSAALSVAGCGCVRLAQVVAADASHFYLLFYYSCLIDLNQLKNFLSFSINHCKR